jgi:hypothetical protein
VLRIQNLQRREMRGEPVAVMRLQRLGRLDDAQAPVAGCGVQLEKADRAEPADQVIDLPVAGQTNIAIVCFSRPTVTQVSGRAGSSEASSTTAM